MKIPREEEGRIIAQSRFDVNEEIGTEETFLKRVSVVGVEHLGLRELFPCADENPHGSIAAEARAPLLTRELLSPF